MSGGILALFSALGFALTNVVLRRALLLVRDANLGVLVSTILGIPFFLIVTVIMGQTSSIVSFSWQSYIWLAAAGIFHPLLGRAFCYGCVQEVGANKTQVIVGTYPLVAAILGIAILGEPFGWKLIVGVLLITSGVMMVTITPEMFRGGKLFASVSRKVLLYGIGAGLAIGISPIFVKLGLRGGGSPIAGAFISFLAAAIVISCLLGQREKRNALFGMNGKGFGYFLLAGVLSNVAHLTRYVALSMAPASLVVPIMSVSPIFLLIASYIFNRKMETFSPMVIVGTIATVIGSVIIW